VFGIIEGRSMSNSDLRSKLSSYQSELSAIERENARLQGEVFAITSAIAAANGALVSTQNHILGSLETGNARLIDAHSTSLSAYELQGEIALIYERLKRMELANKKIRECNNTRYYDFATYRQVRKIVQGVMDNLDLHMVGDEMLAKAIEKKHLETPDFWLTCVLIAITAWKDDAPERAARAINRAMELDKKKVATFLLIFNLRMRRDEAAVKWFETLKGMPLVGADNSMILLFFSLLSRTIHERVADSTREAIGAYVARLMEESLAAAGHSQDEVVGRVEATMIGMSVDGAFDYPLLQRHCTSVESLRTPLALARNNRRIIEFFTEIIEVEVPSTNEFLKEYLDQVVAAPCAVEQAVYDEIERNEAIIRFQGDLEAAEADYGNRKSHDIERLDVVVEMLRWVFDPASLTEVNPQMRLNMVTLLRGIDQEAASRYVDDYRAGFVSKGDVVIGDFTAAADFEDIGPAKDAARAFCDAKCAEEQSTIKDVVAYVLFGVAAATAAGAFFTSWALFIVAAVALVGGAGYLYYNKSERQKVALKHEGIARNLQASLDDLSAEYAEYAREYAEHDTQSDRLIALLESV
jgi:hypothetical protein